MDWSGIISTAISMFGALGVAYITYGMKRDTKQSNDNVGEKVKELSVKVDNQNNELGKVRNELAQNNLQTARVDLFQSIQHTPHEHRAICDLGWNYFVELGGDSWMSGKFTEWAIQEGVDISYIAKHSPHLLAQWERMKVAKKLQQIIKKGNI